MGALSLGGGFHHSGIQLFQPSGPAFEIVQPFQGEMVVIVGDAIVFNK